jgi:hypothetical protein
MTTLTLNLALHDRQLQALNSEATELLFGGATSGGKSHLVRVALITWCSAIDGLQCILIRKGAEDVKMNHIEGPTGFKALLGPFIDAGIVRVTEDAVRWVKSGSLITLQHCQDERKITSAQGVEKHVVVVDEATQIQSRLISYFRGWCRMNEEMKRRLPDWAKGKFPRIIYTANPIGASLSYFRREFVNARPAFSIEKVGAFLRQYIPSLVTDNPSMSAEETRGRIGNLEEDESVKRALLEGDWNAPMGDMFPEWNQSRHVVKSFIPPAWWPRFRTFDWGTAEPFAAHWWAVSDGESFVDHEGRTRWFPRDALICYREWYGCDINDPARGTRMRNEDIADGILRRSTLAEERNMLTISDSLPFQDRGGKTIAQTFYDNGVPLIHGDTSRVAGWSQLRSRLIGIEIDANDGYKTPLIYFCEDCEYIIEYIPALPRHPSPDKKAEDAAEHGEATHCCDSARLAAMARTRPKSEPAAPPRVEDMTNLPTFNQALKMIKRRKRSSASAY